MVTSQRTYQLEYIIFLGFGAQGGFGQARPRPSFGMGPGSQFGGQQNVQDDQNDQEEGQNGQNAEWSQLMQMIQNFLRGMRGN